MTEKLVIKAENKRTAGYSPIFIGPDYHEKMKNLSAATGISMRKLAETMIDFGIENIKIEKSDDGALPE